MTSTAGTTTAGTHPNDRPQAPIHEVFTGEQLTTIPVGTAEDMLTAVAKARAAQQEWASTPTEDRARILERFRGLLASISQLIQDMPAR